MMGMEDLRRIYLADYEKRIARLRAVLTHTNDEEGGRGNPLAVERLYRMFHNLAGSGGAYGLPFVSEIAEKARNIIKPYKERKTPLEIEPAAAIRDAISSLEAYFKKVLEAKGEYTQEESFTPRKIAAPAVPATDHLPRIDDKLPLKILAVDDDEANLRLIHWTLSRENIELLRARSTAEALQFIGWERPDLITVEGGMENMAGYKLVSQLREDQSLMLLPIIMLSSKGSLEDKIRALESGANIFMLKPFHPRELLAAIKAKVAHSRAIQEVVIYDALTGAHSRRYIFERLKEEIRRHQRNMDPLCIAIIDLDYFKKINDTYGHLAGDEILRRVITFLSQHLRSYDTIGRYGGEEFIVLMPNTAKEQAETVLDRIRKAWAEKKHDLGGGIEVKVTFSAGIAAMERPDIMAEDLIYHADRGLYCAKDAGRNRICTEVA